MYVLHKVGFNAPDGESGAPRKKFALVHMFYCSYCISTESDCNYNYTNRKLADLRAIFGGVLLRGEIGSMCYRTRKKKERSAL